MAGWIPPKATEDTITSEILKEELKARGISIATQMTFDTPIGRYQPDLYVGNGSQFVIQGKLGNSNQLIEAIGQVHDGIKWAKVTGGFAVLYPKKLRTNVPISTLRELAHSKNLKFIAFAFFQEADPRPQRDFEGTLLELVDWICNILEEKPKPIPVPLRKVVDVLQRSVAYLIPTLKHMQRKDLEYLFGDAHVFDNILLFDKGKIPLSDLRRAAAHFLVDQILFYVFLSRKMATINPELFPDIEEDLLTKPKQLHSYFWKALNIDYAPIFAFDVVSQVPESELRLLKNVIKTIKTIAPEKFHYDLLGQLFHELIPLNVRKHVAAYYTNPSVAELLACLVIDDAEATILDAAVGSGGLLASAYRAKKSLFLKSNGSFDKMAHNRFVGEQLTGIDVMPFAAHLAAINLTVQGFMESSLFPTNKVRVAIWDATELNPNDIIPPMSRSLRETYKTLTLDPFLEGTTSTVEDRTVIKGTVTPDRIGSDEIHLTQVDLVIMNPPFTKQERIRSGEYKKELKIRFKDYHKYRTKTLGYYGYFVFLADKFLNTSGTLALVLPATVLRVTSAEGVRQMLLEKYHILHIITTWERAAFTEDAQFREILLIAKKLSREDQKNKSKLKTILTYLKRLPIDFKDSQILAENIRDRLIQFRGSFATSYEDEHIKSRTITYQQLSENLSNLYRFVAAYNWELFDLWNEVVGNIS